MAHWVEERRYCAWPETLGVCCLAAAALLLGTTAGCFFKAALQNYSYASSLESEVVKSCRNTLFLALLLLEGLHDRTPLLYVFNLRRFKTSL